MGAENAGRSVPTLNRIKRGDQFEIGIPDQADAVEELQAQKQRLDTYTVQARFALAALYDLSSTVGDASQ